MTHIDNKQVVGVEDLGVLVYNRSDAGRSNPVVGVQATLQKSVFNSWGPDLSATVYSRDRSC